jgi:hypothetical protein
MYLLDQILLCEDLISSFHPSGVLFFLSKFNSVPRLFRGDNSRVTSEASATADRAFPPDIQCLRCVSGSSSPCSTRVATCARARHPCWQGGQTPPFPSAAYYVSLDYMLTFCFWCGSWATLIKLSRSSCELSTTTRPRRHFARLTVP